MTDIGTTLAKPVGPLPLGGWLLAAAGGVGVAVFVRRRGLSQADADAAASAAAAADGLSINGVAGDTTDNTQAGVGGSVGQGDFSGDLTETPIKPTTNAEWRTAAVSALSLGGYDGARAQSVIQTYLAGGTVSAEDMQLVSAAIRLIGAPPDAVKLAGASPSTTGGTNSSAPGRKQYTTNAQWRVAALAYLRNKRHVSYALSHSAIFKYLGLESGGLTSKEGAAVGAAITALGPPPVTPKPKVVHTSVAATSATTSNRRDTGTS